MDGEMKQGSWVGRLLSQGIGNGLLLLLMCGCLDGTGIETTAVGRLDDAPCLTLSQEFLLAFEIIVGHGES